VARHDEQRVVDADAEADHRRERRRDGRDLGHLAEQCDEREADHEADDRGDDGQAHGDDRPEREQEDEHGHRQADGLARVRLGLGHLLAEVAADADRQARVADRVGLGDDALRVVRAEVARARAQVQRDVADPLVLREVRGPGLRERARRRPDVRILPEGRDGVVDRLLVLRVGQLRAGGRGHHDRVRAVRLLREARGEEVARLLAVGARQREVVVDVRPDAARGDGQGGEHGQPHREHDPAASDTDVPEAVEDRRHAARPARRRVECGTGRPYPRPDP
jgi:hypothetical protein